MLQALTTDTQTRPVEGPRCVVLCARKVSGLICMHTHVDWVSGRSRFVHESQTSVPELHSTSSPSQSRPHPHLRRRSLGSPAFPRTQCQPLFAPLVKETLLAASVSRPLLWSGNRLWKCKSVGMAVHGSHTGKAEKATGHRCCLCMSVHVHIYCFGDVVVLDGTTGRGELSCLRTSCWAVQQSPSS